MPGPSPWYLKEGASPVTGFVWRRAGDEGSLAGKTLLVGASGPVAILDFANWVLSLDNLTLLVWCQHSVTEGPTAPVQLHVIRPSELGVLDGDLAELCESMQETPVGLLLDGPETARAELPTTLVGEQLKASFPKQLKELDELLILCHSSGIDSAPRWERDNLALLVAHPKESLYRLFPQDWFNGAGLDYGYQWVTRVVRNPANRRVHGEGFRVAPFVLNETLRQRI
ncbi:MAG: hypothetical protein WBQ14_02870 [Gaiellaceae bacterium]